MIDAQVAPALYSNFQQIYLENAQAGLEPRWSAITELLRSEFQGEVATIVLVHKTGAPEVLAETGAMQTQHKSYRDANWNGTATSTENPYLAQAARLRKVDDETVVSAADLLVPFENVKQTSFYKNHMAAAGVNDALGMLVFDGARLLGKASVVRQSLRTRYSAPDVEKLKTVARYVHNGMLRSRSIRESKLRSFAGEEILRMGNCGLLVFDSRGELLLTDGNGDEIFQKGAEYLQSAVRAFCLERNLESQGAEAPIQSSVLGGVKGELKGRNGEVIANFRLEVRRIFFRNRVFCYVHSGEFAPAQISNIPAGVEFTPRERDVVDLLVCGHGNADIAGRMGIGVYTVKDHLKSIFTKLDVHTRASAVALLTRGTRI